MHGVISGNINKNIAGLCFTYDFSTNQIQLPLWRQNMERFSTLLTPCEGNTPFDRPHKEPVKQAFDAFVEVSLNKQLKNSRLADHMRCHVDSL